MQGQHYITALQSQDRAKVCLRSIEAILSWRDRLCPCLITQQGCPRMARGTNKIMFQLMVNILIMKVVRIPLTAVLL